MFATIHCPIQSEAFYATKIVYTAACPMVISKQLKLLLMARIRTRGICYECCKEP